MASSLESVSRSMIRLTGMASGLDTDALVRDMLKVDQFKVDRQFRQMTLLQWRSDAYREMNLLVSNFRSNNLSVLTPSTNMLSMDAYKAFTVSLLDSTNAVTVSAGSKATIGQVTIETITQLAETAKMNSSNVVTGEIGNNTALKDINFATPLVFDTNDQISFKINGETFTFGKDDLLSDFLGKINSNSKAGVTISYSSLKKGFSIASLGTGTSSKIEIENLTGNAFAADGLPGALGIAEGMETGKDAMLRIDGVDVVRSTNAFTIDGISYTLKDRSDTPIRFNVQRDVDTVYNKIKTFIDNYNTLIDTMQKKIDEETHSAAYPPLTEEERSQLSEDQAKKWDELAKSGIIKNDSNTQNVLNKMRSAFYTKVDGIGKSLADIGLKTSADYMARGKIIIDEATLRSAIENNPDEVAQLFASTSTSTDSVTKFNQSGLVSRISDALLAYTKSNTNIYLEQNDDAVDEAKERLATLQQWMSDNEEKYYARFTAMETALSRLNSQSSWLSSQLGSL